MRSSSLVTLVLATACTLPSEEYSPLLPDARILVNNEDVSGQMRAVGDPSEYAEVLRDLTEQTNTGLGEALSIIDQVTDLPPSYIDEPSNYVLWGPWMAEGVFGQLYIQELDSGDLEWGIQLRPEDSGEDEWLDALLGEIDAGSSEERSTGRFWLDFSVADTLGAEEDVTGELSVSYDLRPDGAVTDIVFAGVSADGVMPRDGGVHFEHTASEGGLMDVVLEEDVQGSGGDALETVTVRARWDSMGAGRTDALITGGDFGEDEHSETECWSAAQTVLFYENTFEGERDGDIADCPFTNASFVEG